MSVYDTIGKAQAEAVLELAKAMGKRIQFRHLDWKCRELWALVGNEEISVVEEGGVQTERRTRKFKVPVQDGFDVTKSDREPATPGDMVIHNGRNYFVLQGGVGKAGNDRVYELTCAEDKRMAYGTGR